METVLFYCAIGILLGFGAGIGVVFGSLWFFDEVLHPEYRDNPKEDKTEFLLIPAHKVYKKKDIDKVIWDEEAKKTYVTIKQYLEPISFDDEFGILFLEIASELCSAVSVDSSIRRYNTLKFAEKYKAEPFTESEHYECKGCAYLHPNTDRPQVLLCGKNNNKECYDYSLLNQIHKLWKDY